MLCAVAVAVFDVICFYLPLIICRLTMLEMLLLLVLWMINKLNMCMCLYVVFSCSILSTVYPCILCFCNLCVADWHWAVR